MKIEVVIITLLLVPLLLVSVQANVGDAESIIKNNVIVITERISTQKEQLGTHPEQIYGFLKETMAPLFDFPIMSRFVLGKVWRQANEQQQQAFIEEFGNLLVRTYGKTLLEYSGQEILYLPVKSNPNSNTTLVKMKIIGDESASIAMDFRLVISDGEWKVIDVSVGGVSLVGTYRGSFASEIRKNGLDTLIEKLNKKNNKNIIPN